MLADGDDARWADFARKAATDNAQISARSGLAKFTAETFSQAGDELYAVGHIFGPDRVNGASPGGHGDDEIVAVSLLLRIGGQLTSACADLFSDGRHYAAAALLRQMVEIEYLAWAFETRHKDGQRWLRSTADERRNFFTPSKLRQAAKGKFRGKDYGYHCELGGHPVPGASVLFQDSMHVSQLLLSDLLDHTGRIWDHLLDWSAGNEWALPIHSRREAMYARYAAWKTVDQLNLLPPPPYVAGRTVSGADKRWYFFRVKDLIEFLSRQWGKPDVAAPYPPAGGGALAGKQGIVLFEVSGWRDVAGHATLWNGRICYDHCYFNEQGAAYRTERANFWSLQ